MDAVDPTSRQLSAMVDELSGLAKRLENPGDQSDVRQTQAAVIMKAKAIVRHAQDPMDAVMDHVTNVSFIFAGTCLCTGR